MQISYRSRPVVIAERQVALGGREIACVIKRSARARRVRFEIREDGTLTVVLPRRCRLDQVEEMVRSKSRWILGKIDAFAQQVRPQGSRRLRDGDTIPFLGAPLCIALEDGMFPTGAPARLAGRAPAAAVEMMGRTLVVRGAPAGRGLEALLEGWLRAQAAAVLQRKAREHAASLGVGYSRFSIRGQRTRWGSCSSRGTLSFNWRLIMAPEPVVDYVVVHEVAHLREMNHTARFWKLVADRCPSWREHRQWLNDHGGELAGLLKVGA